MSGINLNDDRLLFVKVVPNTGNTDSVVRSTLDSTNEVEAQLDTSNLGVFVNIDATKMGVDGVVTVTGTTHDLTITVDDSITKETNGQMDENGHDALHPVFNINSANHRLPV